MRLSLPAGSTVAVLSAERTGATDLIEALAPRLSALGLTVIEGALHAEARKSHRDHALTLLIALDPSVADEHGPDAQRRLEHIDGTLRSALIEAGVEFAVIHGQQEERVTNALRALGLGGR
ncbi:MAG TPA: hypothetical protein VEP93_10285, partial [Variovorax sp.]|nr:hypothetical protein [Variovorax sp.]